MARTGICQRLAVPEGRGTASSAFVLLGGLIYYEEQHENSGIYKQIPGTGVPPLG